MSINLLVVDGPEKGQEFHFDGSDSFLVGRSAKAHLRLDPLADPYISRTHCLLELRPPRCTVTDLGSTNGTRVNGTKVSSVEVAHGDVIRVGRTAFRVLVHTPKETEEEAQRCQMCGADVVATENTGSARPLCARCAEMHRRTTDRSLRRSAPPAVPIKVVSCSGCGADVSETARADTLDRTYQEAHYLCASCIHRETDTSIPSKRIGDYRILNEIGRGGMGVVFRAAHKTSGRLCAIKQLLPDTSRDETARRRFEREIDVQTKVEHPHLVRVWDRARDESESLHFVTEFLAGGDLERFASKVVGGPVEPRLATRLICDVLRGLQELHDRGMIHRDLKPANFLLTKDARDPGCTAKISDYGLAKCYEEAGNSIFAYTVAGHVAGSILFMAPEQITNFRYVRPPADVYSVGVSLYYLLSATYTVDFLGFGAPGQGVDQKQRHPVEMIVEDPPIPILERRRAVPVELARVVDRAVVKNQNDRYQTADDLRKALEGVSAKLGWKLPG